MRLTGFCAKGADGRLDIYGTPTCLIYDTRLRRLLIRAIWHLVITCGPLRFIPWPFYHKSQRNRAFGDISENAWHGGCGCSSEGVRSSQA
jgi:hypothetical protein